MKMNVKRIIALAISLIMVLSMIPVMAISTSAADVEGDWTTLSQVGSEEAREKGEPFNPAPGYKYTSEGFTTVPADWTNYTPFFTAQTKEPQNLKDGFYMEVRIDEYGYGGPEGTTDHWITFAISQGVNVSPGNLNHDNFWLAMVRGAGEGQANAAGWLTNKTTEEAVGSCIGTAACDITIPVDDQGREIYTFEVIWTGSDYQVKLCGADLSGTEISDALLSWVESGDYYIGVTLHCGVPDSTSGITVLKMGTSADDATTPVGSDSKEPDENKLVFADIADPSTVPANQPALMWDATQSCFTGDAGGLNFDIVAQGDDSYRVTSTDAAGWVTMNVKNDLSYSINDFPVFAMVLRDCPVFSGGFYWCAGNVMANGGEHHTGWGVWDVYGENEEYSLVIIDMTGFFEEDEEVQKKGARINSCSPVFNTTPGTEFDICYMGWFRSDAEAEQYAIDRMGFTVETEAPETDPPADDKTPADDDKTPADDDKTPADDDKTPAGDDKTPAGDDKTPAGDDKTPAGDDKTPAGDETDAAAGTNATDDGKETDKADEGGCASVIGMSAVAVLAAAAAAVVLKKKD